jgi:hypothetical protein
MAQEIHQLDKKAQRAAFAAFHCAAGVISWLDVMKRVCAKLKRFSWMV